MDESTVRTHAAEAAQAVATEHGDSSGRLFERADQAFTLHLIETLPDMDASCVARVGDDPGLALVDADTVHLAVAKVDRGPDVKLELEARPS
jgi:hypothetical protein